MGILESFNESFLSVAVFLGRVESEFPWLDVLTGDFLNKRWLLHGHDCSSLKNEELFEGRGRKTMILVLDVVFDVLVDSSDVFKPRREARHCPGTLQFESIQIISRLLDRLSDSESQHGNTKRQGNGHWKIPKQPLSSFNRRICCRRDLLMYMGSMVPINGMVVMMVTMMM